MTIKHPAAVTYQKNIEMCAATYRKTRNSQISWRILLR